VLQRELHGFQSLVFGQVVEPCRHQRRDAGFGRHLRIGAACGQRTRIAPSELQFGDEPQQPKKCYAHFRRQPEYDSTPYGRAFLTQWQCASVVDQEQEAIFKCANTPPRVF
jgi:hypothetical protein